MLYYRKEISVADYLKSRSYEIVDQIQLLGRVQVRYYNERLLSFPYPAARGHGTRGLLVGVYGKEAQPEWILEDINSLISQM